MAVASAKNSVTSALKLIEEKYARKYPRDWQNEKERVEKLLELLFKDVLKEGNLLLESCEAVAGSRIVLKVVNTKTGATYALKICRPFPSAVTMLSQEYELVEKLYHENLIKITKKVEYTLDDPEIKYPVTIEEFVPDGLDLEKWMNQVKGKNLDLQELFLKVDEFKEFVFQIFSGISYLHRQGVFHCDIKPENILISGNTVKIVDFGFSKLVDKRFDGSTDRIGYTWDYAHPDLRKNITEMSSRNMTFAEQKILDPVLSYGQIDLYALGRTIEYCTKVFKESLDRVMKEEQERRESFQNVIYKVSFIEILAGRLKGVAAFQDSEDKKGCLVIYDKELVESISYNGDKYSLDLAIRDLKKLDNELLSVYAEEFNPSITNTIRIGKLDVPFTPRIRKLFNHPYLSRLSNVTQLGLVNYIYPSARHNRLEHSMGTYYYALRYIESLWAQKDDPLFRNIAEPEDIIAASLGALIHDLGQYPHAHDIEDSIYDFKEHEKFSEELYESPVIINKMKYESIKSIVESEWGNSVANLVPRYIGKFKSDTHIRSPAEGILRAIISSPIDADKLDYLQRDSSNLGLKFSSDIETRRLIVNLRPAIVSKRTGNTPIVTLGLAKKGILAAHSLIVAREHMFERVYWHKTVRAFKAMLSTSLLMNLTDVTGIDDKDIDVFNKRLTELVKKAVFQPHEFFSNGLIYQNSLSMHLNVTDLKMLIELEKISINESSKFLVKSIINREPYSTIFEFNKADWLNSPTDLKKVATLIDKMRIKFEEGNYGIKQIETIRRKLQKRIKLRCEYEWKERLNSKEKNRIADVAIIFDFPKLRLSETQVYTIESADGAAREYNLSGVQNEENSGWISATAPRIYINRKLKLKNGMENYEFIQLLGECIN